MNEGQTTTVDLIANDTPIPGVDATTVDLDPSSPLTEEKSATNSMGEFTVDASGVLSYSPPDPDYNGPANITYTVKDGTLAASAPATVTISITPINDAPTISAIANTNVNENSSTPDIPFTIADVDNIFSELNVSAVSSNTTLIPPGGITLGGTDGDRTIKLTPANGQSGTATITVTVNDGEFSATEEFDVQVAPLTPQSPVINITGSLTVAEDGALSNTVTITVTDADTQVENLTLTASTANATLIPNANITLTPGAPGTWTLTVTPAANQNGTTQINLLASDGTGNSDTDPVAVTVTPVNDAPTISSIADQNIPQNGTAGPIGFTINDVDGFTGVTVSASSNNTTLVPLSSIVLGGTNGSRDITVTPATGVSGTATVTVTVSDGEFSAQEDFLLTVTPPSPPVINFTGSLTMAEDAAGSNTVTITVTDADTQVGNLTLTATSANATLIPNANITLTPGAPGTWTLTVTPAANQNGTTQINLLASDGTGNTDSDPVPVTVTPVNDAPTISSIADHTIPQNGATGPINFTITDADGFAGVNVSAVSSNPSLVAPAGIVLGGSNGSRNITVTPTSGASGTATITVTVNDGTTSAVEGFLLTVTPPASPVISFTGSLTATEDGTSNTITITVTDADTPAGNLSLVATSANVTLIPNANISLPGSAGSWTLSVAPAANQNGTTQINLVASDGAGNTDTDAVAVTVTAVNDAPVVVANNNISTNEDTPSAAVAFTVTDIDTTPLSVNVTAASANESLIPSGNVQVLRVSGSNWTVAATPAANANGTTQITLTASDGTLTGAATISATVASVNDLPTISTIANQSINENTSTAALDFTVSDIETPVNSLAMSAASDNATLVPVGNIVFGGGGANRTVTVTPATAQFGSATVTLTVADGNGGTRQTSFQLTVLEVNAPPFFATTIGNQTIDEDVATGSLSFSIGDPNTPIGGLTVTATSSNQGLVDAGGISLGGSGANRSVTITPNINANGNTNITISVSDGAQSTDMVFTLTVNPVNDLPTITSVANQNINENTSTGPLNFTITDLETVASMLTMTSLSSNPALAADAEIVFDPLMNGSLRSVNVTPKINKSGVATITLTVTDESGGTAQTAFLLSVAAVDAPPTISAIDDFSINEDTPSATIPFTVADIDVPAEDLTVTSTSSVTSVVASGGVALVEVSPGNWTVRITPVANASGSSLITLTVFDGTESTTETFTVTVNPVNDLPTISPTIPTQNINEDSNTGAINFAINDLETPIAGLTVSATSSNTTLVPVANIVINGTGGTRTITVTPAADESGSADITIHVVDADGGERTRTFTVVVAPINDTPTISAIAAQNINEDQPGGTGDLAFTVADKEAGALTVTAVSSNQTLIPNANLTLNGTGGSRTIAVVPAANAFGTTTITVTVTDVDGLFASSIFNVAVASVNDAPTITTPPNQTIAENSSTGVIPFTVNDVESAGSLTVTAATSNAAVIPLANVVLAGTGTNRSVTISPLASQSGTSTITLTVTDGTTPVSTTFDVIVTPVEDPPVISAIADQAINEDGATSAIAFTVNDPDTPSPTVTVASDNQSLVPDANVVLGGSGSSRTVTVTPLANQNGTTTITITASDGTNVVTETFLLTVNPVNDTPTITAIADQSTNEDTPTGAVGFTVGDLETAPVSLTVTATSDNATLVPNTPTNLELGIAGASRTIRVIPADNASGVANITVTVSDGAATASRTFKVTVTDMNDLPTITAIADLAINEDTGTGAIAFTIGDQETPAGSLIVTASSSNTTLVPIANLVLGGTGTDRSITISPAFNQNGAATISITVDDGTATTVRDFVLTVNAVNDAPTISAISNRTTNEDASTGPIGFTISDPETAAGSLVVTATTDNPTLFPGIVLGGSGGSRNVNVSPAANLSGSGVITISVTDGTATTDRTFTVTVNPLNDLPQISGQDPISVNEGVAVTLDFVILHVDDPDNAVSELTLLPQGGPNYSLTGPTTITPNASFNGTLSVPVRVSDLDGVGPVFNVSITVISTNDPPVIQSQLTPIVMDEDQTYTIPIANFKVVDPDTDPSLMTLAVLPGTGYTVVNSNQIKPDLNFNGALVVAVKVNDGQADSAPFNATVNVNPINDAPTIVAQTTISTNEETDLLITPGAFTIQDPEGGSYTITVVPPDPGAPYDIVSGSTIRPKLDVTGPITVKVTASDGLLSSGVFDAQVTVVPVNDAPVITGQTALNTVEDVPISIKLSHVDATDVDNTYPNGFSLIVSPGTNYTFTVVSSTEVLITPALDYNGELQVGVQVNDGLASSNTWPFRITVTDDSDAPIITGQNPVSMDEDTQREIKIGDLITTDTDTPEEQRIPSILPGANYTFNGATLIPNANVFGTLTVNVHVYDGEAYSNTFPLQVIVSPKEDPPFFNPVAGITIFEDAPTQTLTITGITAGPLESQTMTLSLVSDNTGLIPAIPQQTLPPGTTTAVFTFKPNANVSGVATIQALLLDAAPGFPRTFAITVTPVNDPPTLDAINNLTLNEDTEGEQPVSLTGIGHGGGAPEDDQTVSAIVSTDNEAMFEIVPQLAAPLSGATGALKFKLKKDAFGTAHVTVRLQDTGPASPAPNVNFVERSFDIIVSPINDMPVIVSEPPGIAEPGKEYVYNMVVTDADGDDITIVASSLPSWMTVTQGENGHATFTGVAPASSAGTPAIQIDIAVTDETGAEVPGDYTLTINSRPIVSDISLKLLEDTEIILAKDDFDPSGFEDPDGNPLAELQIRTLPRNGLLHTSTGVLVSPNDKFTADQIIALIYTPNPNFNGIDTLRWTAADPYFFYPAGDKLAKLTFEVGAVNDVPEFTMEVESDTLFYELGSEKPVKFTRQFHCWDVDGDLIKGAEIGFKRLDGFQYRELNDRLLFQNRDKIIGQLKDGGVLTLTGAATAVEYDSAIRNVLYNYVDAVDLTLDARSIYVQITDGIAQSAQHARIVQLIYTFEDLIIPSAFSPNDGDNVNSTWVISTPKDSDLVVYNDAEIKVYNKNGVLLYHTTGLDSPWTGIYNGSLLPTDTYYYTIDLHYNKVRYKGSVTLLR